MIKQKKGQSILEYVLILSLISLLSLSFLIRIGNDIPVMLKALINHKNIQYINPTITIPDDYTQSNDTDFTWIIDASGYSVDAETDIGYYRYIGTSLKPIIPKTIYRNSV